MTKMHNINIKVSQSAYEAFKGEADKHNYFIAGLFRQFLAGVFTKYGVSTAGIAAPTTRQRHKAEKKSVGFQLSASFMGNLIVERFNMVYMRQVAAKPSGGLSKSAFILSELQLFLAEKGHVFSIEEMKAAKPAKKVVA